MTSRFDIFTIFPDYFAPLEQSLIGKARRNGLLRVNVYDLRRHGLGRHRSVDDTPAGGGCGMVMRPDVWAAALDEVIKPGGDYVLAVPTPSGQPLTQDIVGQLAETSADIVIACGRYEGIDRRVITHYRGVAGVRILEYSLGDYVLNGGEVAALALVEAVGRLVDGVVGNPGSLVEESHCGDGLLEGPVYTQPHTFRGLEVPAVLTGGNHARIARQRRDEAISVTVHRRPDIVCRLGPAALVGADAQALARSGYVFVPGPDGETLARLGVSVAGADEAGQLSALAGSLFPDACPPGLPARAIEEFVRDKLGLATFAQWLDDRDVAVLGASLRSPGAQPKPVGYAVVMRTVPEDAEFTYTVPPGPAQHHAFLSKLYVSRQLRGRGVAAALLEAALREATSRWPGLTHVALGTNRGNRAALSFYRRNGFGKAGTRIFDIAGVRNDDLVLVRDLTANPPKPDLTSAPPMWKDGTRATDTAQPATGGCAGGEGGHPDSRI